MSETSHEAVDQAPRRNFLLEFWAVVTGGIAGMVPFLTGLAVLLDPLRRGQTTGAAELVRVASLDALPDDGVPRQFAIIKDKVDAWTYSPDERVGAVFLIRQPGTDDVTAFNCVCPHAGCFVGYSTATEKFQCPCHTSSFDLDGTIINPSPSPRDMDALDVEIKDQWVHVAFANFKIGIHDKVEK